MENRHILVVDDSILARKQVVQSFRGIPNWVITVHEAADYDEAMRILDEQPVLDLVISDVNMPGDSGIDLAGSIRRHSVHNGIPIVFLTSAASSNLSAQAQANRVTAIIPKPINQAKLEQLLRALFKS